MELKETRAYLCLSNKPDQERFVVRHTVKRVQASSCCTCQNLHESRERIPLWKSQGMVRLRAG